MNSISTNITNLFPTDNNNLSIIDSWYSTDGMYRIRIYAGTYGEGLIKLKGKNVLKINIITFQSSSNLGMMRKRR